MTDNDKIMKSLKASTEHLNDSILALKKKNDTSYDSSLWNAASELEYALFMFSTKFQDESATLKWKPSPDLKKLDTKTALAEAQELLSEAEKQMTSKKGVDSYKNAYIARHYLLKAQEELAKKKREAFKKK